MTTRKYRPLTDAELAGVERDLRSSHAAGPSTRSMIRVVQQARRCNALVAVVETFRNELWRISPEPDQLSEIMRPVNEALAAAKGEA